ncbi:tetratricopeptide repeat protein [Anseongella ginsenosidimutans]|uniref:Tetratricopeptide repeat protein n=1 Tax=Anseongella ginsenosidimutans TaxID=496056 RepID=A0A4R3KV01_9SPHI|nr:tetratricopeptide repeat protein [Anseongella ginsenosidimutans]QEC51767.1 tetratricopeptide repeat protein [Anseongella ginsenosidimutans]TCS89135.1 tetratricopeptide repeat protein [Anseongella ginsenosidimutans]
MFSGKQIGVILSVGILITALYLLPVKGLVNPEEENSSEPAGTEAAFGPAELAEAEKQNINPSLLVEIEEIEKELAEKPGDTALLKKLAGEWEELNISNVSGLYYMELAEKQPTAGNWLKAGDQLREGYKTMSDTIQRSFLVDKALSAYQHALQLDPENLDAQTGLGAVTVEGTPAPMKGIQLLLGVVEKDPGNPGANLTLGKFSMQTGQYEKARDRFLTVVESQPGGEVYFYLGEAYRQLGEKENAIAAYETTKKYIVDPQFTSMIDNIIEELK